MVKSLKDLEEVREKALSNLNIKKEREEGTRIVVGMATCGIAAGARPVLNEFEEQVQNSGLKDVAVLQTGCIGACRLEPIAEIFVPGQEKITYVKLNAEMVDRIVAEHIVGGNPVKEYTVGYYEAHKK